MNTSKLAHSRKLTAWLVAVSLATPWPYIPSAMAAATTPLTLSPVPLFISASVRPNVLLILDNSNSMDEDASGAAVGGASPNSKSEIARGVAKSLITTYTGKINMGLMAYQQGSNSLQNLHNSPYDVSFDPSHYDPTWLGNRADPTHKKFRTPNLSIPAAIPAEFVYYNVALPFYSGSNQGTSFCLSTTADASPNLAHPDGFWEVGDSLTGPWDSYSCFSTKTGTSNTTGWSNPAGTYTFSPTDSDYAQNIVDFGQYMTWNWVSLTWFNNASPGRGYLHTPIKLLDATQAGSLNTKLGTSQFTNNQPTNAGFPLQNAGLTPLEGTLLTANDYFGGAWSNTSEGYNNNCYPLPTSCGKNFVILLTDGLPSTDKNGQLLSSASAGLAASATAAATLKANNIETYVVGFALPYGTNPAQLDSIAAAGGTVSAYSANNPSTLNTALVAIFADILAKSGSAAAVATNSTSLNAGSAIYQAKFDPADWSGQLLAYTVGTTGVIPTTPTWDAAAVLPSYSARQIISSKPSSGLGIPFQWPVNPASPSATEMDTSQSTAVSSSAVLDYLRGSASNEGTAATNFRQRLTSKLGDIVNSSPIYVGKPAGGYAESIEAVSYANFVANYETRTAVLYVGANDGMLHGFRASDGVELISYIPSPIYPNLQSLSSKTYSHKYFVDGSPTAADVYYDSLWHTVLVGGLNGGGQGIFALDITNPAFVVTDSKNISGAKPFSEANASSLVLWEFTDRDQNTASTTNTNFDADLGYTYSQPAVGKMQNGDWAAVFGNGYNNTVADGAASTTGNAVLYIVDVKTGALIKKIDTKKGWASSPNTTTPNGLSSPALVDIDGDEVIDYIYAGDLQGNMWKFDVSVSNPSNWESAFGSAANPAPLFTAVMGTTPQPITVRPEVGQHPEGGLFVYFGTGKYIEVGDNVATGNTTQTFYGIWDKGATVSSRTNLLKQEVLAEVTSNSEQWRLTSNNLPNWTPANNPTNKGWYIDLYNTQNSNTNNYGERQVSNPVLTNKRLVFTTLIPEANVCLYGGNSWLMELNPETGGRLSFSPFDVNGTGGFSTADFLTGGSVTTAAPVSGRKLTGGIAGTPAIMYDPSNKTEIKYFSQSSGVLKAVKENPGGASGRLSWREIIRK